uniref:Uncharacterized protein n=1 Tax=Anguilla anguilla TaxID=7936 RepID=A0A0E9S1Q0_ANGAN
MMSYIVKSWKAARDAFLLCKIIK